MKKIIFILCMIASFLQAQTPTGNRKVWADTLKVSRGGQFVDILTVLSDSTLHPDNLTTAQSGNNIIQKIFVDSNAVKAITGAATGTLIAVTSLNSSNPGIGGGLFRKAASGHGVSPDGWNVLAASGGGYWVRVPYVNLSTFNQSDTLDIKPGGVTNAQLAGSIVDSKLQQITTSNKVAGSAVQLNSSGAIENSTGLKVKYDASNFTVDVNNQLAVKPGGISWAEAGGDLQDSVRAGYGGTPTFVNNPGGITISDNGADSLEVIDGSISSSKISTYGVASTNVSLGAINAQRIDNTTKNKRVNYLASTLVWEQTVNRTYVELDTNGTVAYFYLPIESYSFETGVTIDSIKFYVKGNSGSSVDYLKIKENNYGTETELFNDGTNTNCTGSNQIITWAIDENFSSYSWFLELGYAIDTYFYVYNIEVFYKSYNELNTYSAYFDSTTWLSLASTFHYTSSQAWTVEFWVKRTVDNNIVNGGAWLLSDDESSGRPDLKYPGYNFDGPQYERSTGTISATFGGDSSDADYNRWIHVAVAFDGGGASGNIKIYQGDASTPDTVANSTAGSTDFGIAVIGKRQSASTNYYKGYIDELRVWNTYRTLEQIQANYKKELAGNESGLVYYWKFNGDLTSSATANTLTVGAGSITYSTDKPF